MKWLLVFAISLQFASAEVLTSPSPSPTPTSTSGPTPSPTPIPSPGLNQCAFQFSCLCNETSNQQNCGTAGGNPCSCGNFPPPSSCMPGGTTTTLFCQSCSGSCTGGNPPNSFNPPLQRNQCRRTYAPGWANTGVSANCSVGKVCPPSSNVQPTTACTLGAPVVNVSASCI